MPDKKHVLLVEDDKRLSDEILSGLDKLGYLVDWVCCMSDADHMLETRAYDLIICDNRFPVRRDSKEALDNMGLDLLEQVRIADERHFKVPFILHTGDDRASMRERVEKRKGIFCPKGQTSPNLYDVVAQALLAHV